MHHATLLKKQPLTNHIIELTLKMPAAFSFSAGQYVMAGLDADDLKPFSIANLPSDDNRIVLQIKNAEQSDWMNRLFSLELGANIWVSTPKDQYPLVHADQPTLFIAGGTGYAPMYALLLEKLSHDNPAESHFYWGAQSPDELYHLEQISALAAQHPSVTFQGVISNDTQSWTGETGLVHLAALNYFKQLTGQQKSQLEVYLCGPWAMRQSAIEDFVAAGLALEQFH